MHLHHDHGPSGTLEEDDKAVCPVMNVSTSKSEATAKNMTRKYNGETYYLCCKTCEGLFDKDPAKYVFKKAN